MLLEAGTAAAGHTVVGRTAVAAHTAVGHTVVADRTGVVHSLKMNECIEYGVIALLIRKVTLLLLVSLAGIVVVRHGACLYEVTGRKTVEFVVRKFWKMRPRNVKLVQNCNLYNNTFAMYIFPRGRNGY